MMFAAVDVMPLMTVVRRFPVEVATELLIIEEVDTTPFTVEVRVFTAEASALAFTKLAVVVATLPLTIEVRMRELVVVATERV